VLRLMMVFAIRTAIETCPMHAMCDELLPDEATWPVAKQRRARASIEN
jgi:hypothetical protein